MGETWSDLLGEAIGVIRLAEWIGPDGLKVCPVCYGQETLGGHLDGCEVSAFLGKIKDASPKAED